MAGVMTMPSTPMVPMCTTSPGCSVMKDDSQLTSRSMPMIIELVWERSRRTPDWRV